MKKEEKDFETIKKKLVGTKQTFSGGLFSHNKSLPEMEYNVLDIRVGSAHIQNLETGEFVCPTFELLLKREGMKRAQWSRGFPLRIKEETP